MFFLGLCLFYCVCIYTSGKVVLLVFNCGRIYKYTYLPVVSSPCSTHSGLEYNGLMAFLHLDLSLARLIFRCFLRRSALTTSFHFNFGLPRDVGPSTLKLMNFFVHDVSSCRNKYQTASVYSI